MHAASTNLVENTVTVGGEINVVGDGTAGKIARWDGDSWEPMGNPFNGAVRTIVEKDGFTYAGGDFTKAGFSNTPKVARWNGSQWQSIGTGIQGPAVGTRVNSIAFFENNLYVAGNFTKAGGVNAADIAYWDGDEWHAIGGTDANGEIHEIVVHGTRLCAAGAFEEIGGLKTEGVACWTGSQWQELDNGLNGTALAAVVHNGDLFVGGSFSFAGGVNTGRLAKWNGIDWVAIGYPLTQQVVALGSRGGILVVGTNGGSASDPAKPWLIEWNGVQWTNAVEQPDGPVLGFAPSPAGVLVVGSFPRANQTVLGGVGVWTGGIFVTYLEGSQLGLHGNAHAFAVWNGDLYVAGNFKAAGDEPAGMIARWSVDHWEPVGNYAVNGSASVDALVAGEDGLYAAGRFGLIGGVEADNVARWDGAQWSPVGTGLDNRVSALLAHDGKIYAGGTFLKAGAVAAPKLAVWDGVAWSALVAGGGVSGDVSALAAFGGDVIAGGAFTSAAGSVPARGVVRYDGEAFQTMGAGLEGTVRALHVHDGTLYAGGAITATGETVLSGLASWSGSAWQPVGTGVRLGNQAGSVLAMTSFEDSLVVGGSFSRAGDAVTRQIARYDDGSWSAFAPGLREPASTGGETVTALAVHDDWLWIGGNFVALADGRPAARVIAWASCEAGNEAACPTTTTTTTTEVPLTTTTLAGQRCGDVNDDGNVTATDALFALRAAVGARQCELSVCDADGNLTISATDALRILRSAVGQAVELACP